MTNPLDYKWKETGTNIPSLLPLQAAPQEEGQVVNYLQALHNYLASDRLEVVRALNVLSRFRMLQTSLDSEQTTTVPATGSGTFLVNAAKSVAYFDPVTQGVTSSAVWLPIIPEYATIIKEPTGFVYSNLDTTLSIAAGVFTIAPTMSTFSFYVAGKKFTKTTAQNLNLSAATTKGNWYIYYDDTGTLVLDGSVTLEDIIHDNCFVAELYHDGTNITIMMDERHGTMPWQTHLRFHVARGTIHRSGLGLTAFVVDGDGNTDSHAEFNAAAGIIMDEDIQLSLGQETLDWHTLHLDTGKWVFTDHSAASPVMLSGGVPQYNDVSTPGSEGLASVSTNKYFLLHIFATNILTEGDGTVVTGHVAILGQSEYATKPAARIGANVEIGSIITTGLPMPEFLPVGTVIFQRKGSNAYNSAVVSTDTGDNYVSWIGSEIAPGSPPSSHANLTHRDDPDQHSATSITPITTSFGAILSVTEDTVQKALDVLDDHTIASHSDTTATGAELETLTDGSDAGALHIHDSRYYTETEIDALLHAESHTIASHSDTTATGAELETLTDGSDAGALHIHDSRYYTETEIDALLHAESHTIASHSDTTATGAELETLTDGSDAGALHTHGAIFSGYLPLTAGISYPLTGHLYIESVLNPSIFLREGGSTTHYTRIYDPGTGNFYIEKYAGGADHSYLNFKAITADPAKWSYMKFNSGGAAAANCFYQFYAGNKSTECFRITGSGAVNLFTGHLYLDKSSDPAIYLREGGSATSYLKLHDNGAYSYIEKFEPSGNSTIILNPLPVDGSGGAYLLLFRSTNTTGVRSLQILKGDNTYTIQHEFNAGTGDVNLCKIGGDLCIDAPVDPTIKLREGGSAAYFTQLYDGSATQGYLRKTGNGTTYLDIDSMPINGTSGAQVRLFRWTNTTGSRYFSILKGDGTSTIQHLFNAGTGNVDLCKIAGALTVGGTTVSLVGHIHDDRYYTETEIDAFLHAESHTIASHSDTTATGAELETLTNSSDAGVLHVHDSRYYIETEIDTLLENHTHIENDITDLDHNDGNAIHDNVANEFSSTSSASSAGLDRILFEDQSAAWAKRYTTVNDLDVTDSRAIHDNQTAEISALSAIAAADADVLICEDASGGFPKRKITFADLKTYILG